MSTCADCGVLPRMPTVSGRPYWEAGQAARRNSSWPSRRRPGALGNGSRWGRGSTIEAERARQAMIADIMRDPRLAGMGLSEAEITAMTGQPVAATGAEQARTLVTGARQVDIGGQLTETIDEQFRAQSDTYIALGGVMITWISTGMEAASPDVVGSLAKLLFPHLVDLQTQAGNRP